MQTKIQFFFSCDKTISLRGFVICASQCKEFKVSAGSIFAAEKLENLKIQLKSNQSSKIQVIFAEPVKVQNHFFIKVQHSKLVIKEDNLILDEIKHDGVSLKHVGSKTPAAFLQLLFDLDDD